MNKTQKKRDEVIIGIIITVTGGVILMFVEPLRNVVASILRGFASFTGDILKIIWKYLTSGHSISGSVIVILVILSVLSVIHLAGKLKENVIVEAYTKYIEDSYFGVRWRWSWDYGSISNLVPYCPSCDLQLRYEDGSIIRHSKNGYFCLVLFCDHCGTVVGKTEFTRAFEVEDFIRREIERKVRTNTYPGYVSIDDK